MDSDTFKLLYTLDIKAIGTQMALRCAPLIMGLKESNLLNVPVCQAAQLHRILRRTPIKSRLLYWPELNRKRYQNAVFLLYRYEELFHYLAGSDVRGMLWKLGYHDFSFDGLFDILMLRYTAYLCGRGAFPHEMGLFLGYPPEDVRGFIENNGKNFLCTGYWKVYGDAEQKARLFWYFDRARDLLIRFLAQGIAIEEVLALA